VENKSAKLKSSRIHLHEYVIVTHQSVSEKGKLIATERVSIYLKHYDMQKSEWFDQELDNKFLASFASFKDAMKYLFTKID
jgi:hypothetical protein